MGQVFRQQARRRFLHTVDRAPLDRKSDQRRSDALGDGADGQQVRRLGAAVVAVPDQQAAPHDDQAGQARCLRALFEHCLSDGGMPWLPAGAVTHSDAAAPSTEASFLRDGVVPPPAMSQSPKVSVKPPAGKLLLCDYATSSPKSRADPVNALHTMPSSGAETTMACIPAAQQLRGRSRTASPSRFPHSRTVPPE
jgi:hypothetical protein